MAQTPEERFKELLEQWSLSEPALFLALSTHKIVANPATESIRIGRGMVEYNPGFIERLDRKTFKELMRFEATRILLKHPYDRQQPRPALSFLASSITIREHLNTTLTFPTAFEVFKTHDFDRSFLEFYYRKLQSQIFSSLEMLDVQTILDLQNAEDSEGREEMEDHLRAAATNAELWDEDILTSEIINQVIEDISASQGWGSIPGNLQESILATLKPQLDYRKVLRGFRSSIISTSRVLTRMKPNRRYGFKYMGSRRDFVTRLLFAVDVSGSVSSEDLANGFSIINRFFKYGVESIDVIQFDVEVRDKPQTLKKAKETIEVIGRGGTCFQCVMDFAEQHPGYDGLILFTDGYAPMPTQPDGYRPTDILWLFNQEANWKNLEKELTRLGMRSAFVMK